MAIEAAIKKDYDLQTSHVINDVIVDFHVAGHVSF